MARNPTPVEHDANELGQPVGFKVLGWEPPPLPSREIMQGRFCRLEPLDAKAHGAKLFEANALDKEGRMWTYLSHGPFDTLQSYLAWAEGASHGDDPIFFTIVDSASNAPLGVASYMRIDRKSGVIEVGSIAYSPRLQRSPAATEAMFLMMRNIFDLGYRRYEWKCSIWNAPSRAAAQRLGFSYEGVFRNHMVVKGRNRDTAWYSIIEAEWPALRGAYERWLAPENFDESGRQKSRLSDLTAPLLKARG